jgi:hypothetical protein
MFFFFANFFCKNAKKCKKWIALKHFVTQTSSLSLKLNLKLIFYTIEAPSRTVNTLNHTIKLKLIILPDEPLVRPVLFQQGPRQHTLSQ